MQWRPRLVLLWWFVPVSPSLRGGVGVCSRRSQRCPTNGPAGTGRRGKNRHTTRGAAPDATPGSTAPHTLGCPAGLRTGHCVMGSAGLYRRDNPRSRTGPALPPAKVQSPRETVTALLPGKAFPGTSPTPHSLPPILGAEEFIPSSQQQLKVTPGTMWSQMPPGDGFGGRGVILDFNPPLLLSTGKDPLCLETSPLEPAGWGGGDPT